MSDHVPPGHDRAPDDRSTAVWPPSRRQLLLIVPVIVLVVATVGWVIIRASASPGAAPSPGTGTTTSLVTTTSMPEATTSDPTSSSTPETTTSLAAPGPAAGLAYWPDETTTGVPEGTALTPSGDITITEPGTVIEGLEVTGCIKVRASDVVIRKTRIKALGCGVETDLEGTYSNVLVEDVEIDGQGDLKLWLIGWTGFTCRRCYLHGGFSGAHPRANTVIEDSYINTVVPGGSSEGRHLSGIGFHGGDGMVLRHNRVECTVSGCSAALSLYGNFEQVANVTVEDNYFSGGGYCVYAGSLDSKPFPLALNTKFIGNAFALTGVGEFPKCGRFGAVAGYADGNGNEWRDNYWLDDQRTPLTL